MSKWEDTVMKPQELIRLPDDEFRETNTDIEKSLEAQAEISFKAGIYEMIETYKSHNPESYKKYKAWWDCIGGIITDREPG